MRNERDRLRDIQEAIEHINRYTSQGRVAFDGNELIQTWVVHHLLLIGEACAALPVEVRALASAIPWRNIIGMRNILVHTYFAVDHDVVWGVVEKELPQLHHAIAELLTHLEQP